MKLNVAVQMDPIARINIRGDSTFALLLEAQKRGHGLSYYTPDKLSLLGEELVEEETLAAPAIAYGVDAGTAVGIDDEGNAVGRGVGGRKQDGAVEFGGFIGGGELEGLGLDELVALDGFGFPERRAVDGGLR